jgi:hypothetical protein
MRQRTLRVSQTPETSTATRDDRPSAGSLPRRPGPGGDKDPTRNEPGIQPELLVMIENSSLLALNSSNSAAKVQFDAAQPATGAGLPGSGGHPH